MTNQPATSLGIADIIGDKCDAILALAAKYGASNVRVFGSVARGEARHLLTDTTVSRPYVATT